MQDLYLPYNVIYDKKAFYYSWKCIHRAVYTESKLHKMNKSNGTCKLCKMQRETICHLNYECSEVINVWTKISKLIFDVTKTKVDLNKRNVFFHYKEQKPVDIFCNFIILNTKYCIWKNRNDVKFNNKNSAGIDSIVDEITKMSKNLISVILKSQCKINSKLKEFMTVLNEM